MAYLSLNLNRIWSTFSKAVIPRDALKIEGRRIVILGDVDRADNPYHHTVHVTFGSGKVDWVNPNTNTKIKREHLK